MMGKMQSENSETKLNGQPISSDDSVKPKRKKLSVWVIIAIVFFAAWLFLFAVTKDAVMSFVVTYVPCTAVYIVALIIHAIRRAIIRSKMSKTELSEYLIKKQIADCERGNKWAVPLAIIFFIVSFPLLAVPPCALVTIAGGIFLLFTSKLNKKKIAEPTGKLEQGIILTKDVKHITGLPIGEFAPCKLILTEEKCKIAMGNQEYLLGYDKIIAAETATIEQISYVSECSTIGGVIGGLLLGTAGAVIGSAPKSRRVKDKTYYLIINYTADDEIKAIVFEVSHFLFAEEIEEVIKEHMPNQVISREI